MKVKTCSCRSNMPLSNIRNKKKNKESEEKKLKSKFQKQDRLWIEQGALAEPRTYWPGVSSAPSQLFNFTPILLYFYCLEPPQN